MMEYDAVTSTLLHGGEWEHRNEKGMADTLFVTAPSGVRFTVYTNADDGLVVQTPYLTVIVRLDEVEIWKQQVSA